MTEKHIELIPAIVEGIQDKKGHNITLIDLASLGISTTSQFVVCQGNSTSQVTAIADNIREHVQKTTGRKPYSYDGYRNAQWIVIDYGEAMVHVFLPEVREHYNLEELWCDAPITQIPDLD